MAWILVGLGNPGEEYIGTRHNVGREFLLALAKKEGITEWKTDKKLRALVAKGDFLGSKVMLVLPETFMNNSGGSLKPLIDSKKKLAQLIVVHDELDLPLGKVKISVGSGPGGHNGVLSVQKALKSQDFARIRIGISPATAKGKAKRPDPKKIIDFVIGKFRKPEEETLKKVRKVVGEALEDALNEGISRAMTNTNSR
jgi:PTH1 family peptidyl-tRNA hydrolase